MSNNREQLLNQILSQTSPFEARLAAAKEYAQNVRRKWKRTGKLPPIVNLEEYNRGKATKDRSTD